MKQKISRALTITKDHGFRKLLLITRRFVSQMVKDRYWKLKGSQTLEFNDTEVTFSTPTQKAALRTQWRLEEEKSQLKDVMDAVASGDVFFDIGANTGLYTLFVAKENPSAHVIAFEPYPPNAELLRQDVCRNNLENVSVYEVALSNQEGSISFQQPNRDDYGFGTGRVTTEEDEGNTRVSAISADKLVRTGEIPSPNVVKIDVEGSEPHVIEGMATTLAEESCQFVVCEIHLPSEGRSSIEDFGASVDSLKGEFEDLGYEVTLQPRRSKERLLEARKC